MSTSRSCGLDPALVEHLLEVVAHLGLGPDTGLGIGAAEPAEHGVHPGDEQRGVLGGEVDGVQEHVGRERVGEGRHEVAAAVVDEGVDVAVGRLPRRRRDPGDHARREAGVVQGPVLAVLGRVEERRDERVLGVGVADDRRLVGERRRLLERMADGVEPGDDPVPAVEVAPERGVLLAQLVPLLEVGEDRPRLPDVDRDRRAPAWSGAVPTSCSLTTTRSRRRR